MPISLQQFNETQPVLQSTTFTSADTTVAKSILSTANGPQRIDDIVLCSNDTAAVNFDLYLRIGSTSTFLGSVTVPAGAGFAGVPPILFFYQLNITDYMGLNLAGNMTLFGGCEATMTAAKTLTCTVFGGIF
jgi:hypothetical protein